MNSCPKCKSSKIISIVYGMPASDLAKDEEEGKVILGGCVIREDAPDYHCKDCEYEWKKEESPGEKICKTCGDVVMYCKCYEDLIDEYGNAKD
tara:strand:+ start:42 stop:320 length:279 start_codon:yes stop_codon:yes gene_type:complete